MKKNIIFISLFFMSIAGVAQVNKKDTVFTDSTHIEKIKKMPMDTVQPHTMPVKPVLPEQQKDKKRNSNDPITPSGGNNKKPKK
ncbi:MAG: hypothetical protein K0Q95_2741 [Bacteroidota bacterium]|nr:hypothetical protein [Bacteroidota bacterium]